MTLDFPSSPNPGDVYTLGSRTWTWTGSGWQATPSSVGPQGIQGTQGTQGVQGVQGTFGPATIPQNSKSSSYTLDITDNGKFIDITTGGVTIPSGVFSAGQNVVIYNNSSLNQSITQGTSATVYYAGTTNTGDRVLAGRGVCTVLCVATNTFLISGAGLS
jgi:hypothetical protein